MFARKMFIIFSIVLIGGLSGCGDPNLPELFPQQTNGHVEPQPCAILDSATGKYHLNSVTIRNFGAAIDGTTLGFEFNGVRGPESVTVPAIPPGGTVTRELSSVIVPDACLSGTCMITITVDPDSLIAENNETNNSATCEIPG